MLAGKVEVGSDTLLDEDVALTMEALDCVIQLVKKVVVKLGPANEVTEVQESGNCADHSIRNQARYGW